MHLRDPVDARRRKKHALPERLHQCGLDFLPMLQRVQSSALRHGRRRKHHVLIDLLHDTDDRLRRNDASDPLACHHKVLRKAVQRDRALRHARQARERHKRVLVTVRRIDLIADDDQIISFGNARDLPHGFCR